MRERGREGGGRTGESESERESEREGEKEGEREKHEGEERQSYHCGRVLGGGVEPGQQIRGKEGKE